MPSTKRKTGRPVIPARKGEKSMLGVRVTASLKDRLVSEARRQDRSLSAEAEARLEQSFSRDDEFGGPELRMLAHLMAAAFALGGRRGAAARKHPEWSPDEWMADPFAYNVATRSVVNALLAQWPDEPVDANPLRDAMRQWAAENVARGIQVTVETASSGEES